MTFWEGAGDWLLIEAGVILSLLVPWAMAIMRADAGKGEAAGADEPKESRIVRWLKAVGTLALNLLQPYWKYLGASLVVSFVVFLAILALHKSEKVDLPSEWWQWIIVGLAWDTVYAKFTRENPIGFRGVPKTEPPPAQAPGHGAVPVPVPIPADDKNPKV